MSKTIVSFGLCFTACGFLACAAQNSTQVSTPPLASNANVAVQKTNDSAAISSHSTARSGATPAVNSVNPASSPSSAGNSPMAKAIDVMEMTASIEKAEKVFKGKPNDSKAKDTLAEAYFVRAFALTEAAQYRAALGDFRKGLKLNPNAAEAKEMHDRIISIFQSINREPPQEGKEPPPLPFDKKS